MVSKGAKLQVSRLTATGVFFMLRGRDKRIVCGFNPHTQGSIAPVVSLDTTDHLGVGVEFVKKGGCHV